jgi:hypothetical protein
MALEAEKSPRSPGSSRTTSSIHRRLFAAAAAAAVVAVDVDPVACFGSARGELAASDRFFAFQIVNF